MKKSIIAAIIAASLMFLALDNRLETYAYPEEDNILVDTIPTGTISLAYECGNKSCTSLPQTMLVSKNSTGITTVNVSSIEPVSTDGNYVFWYWTNKSETIKYRYNCGGLSNCQSVVSMTQDNVLHAKWRLDTAMDEEITEISNNSTFCKTMLMVVGLLIIVCLGFLTYSFLRIKKENEKSEQ